MLTHSGEKVETETLDKELQHTLEEARTVIPGLQALFGFQLIVAFHPSFKQLESSLKFVQLGALVALALAIALIMTPAAYHRMALRGKVSRPLIDITSRLIAYATAAFTIAITLNMFLLASVVLESQIWGLGFGMGAFVVFAGLWFGYPMLARQRKHRRARPRRRCRMRHPRLGFSVMAGTFVRWRRGSAGCEETALGEAYARDSDAYGTSILVSR